MQEIEYGCSPKYNLGVHLKSLHFGDPSPLSGGEENISQMLTCVYNN